MIVAVNWGGRTCLSTSVGTGSDLFNSPTCRYLRMSRALVSATSGLKY